MSQISKNSYKIKLQKELVITTHRISVLLLVTSLLIAQSQVPLLCTHRVGEAEAGEIAGGEQARSERRLRGDVVAGLVLGRRRRRGVIRAADEGLQLQLRRALLHPRPSPQQEAS